MTVSNNTPPNCEYIRKCISINMGEWAEQSSQIKFQRAKNIQVSIIKIQNLMSTYIQKHCL